jgi:hypothetical protein
MLARLLGSAGHHPGRGRPSTGMTEKTSSRPNVPWISRVAALARRRGSMYAAAAAAGALLGIVAQVLRQILGALMDIGAATAPWVTIGFLLALWATRTPPRSNAAATGTRVAAAYLYAWLAAYHLTFAVRESVGLGAAWREAAPWLVLAAPAALVLGWLAARSHESGIVGDACLAAPIAWSLPEIALSLENGWSTRSLAAIAIAVLAFLPALVVVRRDVVAVRVFVATVLLAAAIVIVSPLVLSHVRS